MNVRDIKIKYLKKGHRCQVTGCEFIAEKEFEIIPAEEAYPDDCFTITAWICPTCIKKLELEE